MLDTPENPGKIAACGASGPSGCSPRGKRKGPAKARLSSARGILASHALPPVDLSGSKSPALDEPEHVPAADPDRVWRRRGRWAEAVASEGAGPDGPEVLRDLDAAARLDLFLAVAEEASMSIAPDVRAFARLMIEAGEALARGATDRDGRAVPLGRILGLQPPAGSTAAHRVKLTKRDAMLRRVREVVPAFRDAPDRVAAAAMVESFARYRAGGWEAHAGRDRAPATEPAATWWRVLRLGLAVPLPDIDRLADILAE